MNYVGKLYRPPSEADAYILQATVGCSWNKCTYCDMYRDKPTFRARSVDENVADLRAAGARFGRRVEKLFVADGDALVMPVSAWEPLLREARRVFPNLRRVSAYAMARNLLEKSADELAHLRTLGLSRL